ncbi:bifunctional indole-3-glycerol-phosphate synthase TrpC/phosphoribosylanthranilate isomerase TrpF [Vibrio sp. 99-8-1]|nr:bifunctional indole-3-glycerol-phosphate synthase TrpC/phosphoribosylanthranilate isomerase TrpF [Vibrio sp. 99-8-1]
MAQVLFKIVEDKKQWVEQRKATQPLASFIDTLEPSDRDFYHALSGDKAAFILECKKASPSKGLIREEFDLDYIASVYKNYASAISVLTDEKYFQGSFDFINQIKNNVEQPVLCKDFMIDPYQVYLARYYGANAILLMLSVLDDAQYLKLSELAHSLNLGILTEASNQEEVERAIALKAKVIGINNRNLRDLSIDLTRTRELAPQIPAETVVISESGIYSNQQVRDLRQYVDGYLIGSSLMSEENLELAVRSVLVGDNKVCGLTHPDDAAAVYQAGAVYGGLIFANGSKRQVDIEQARLTMSGAPLKYVGVFQNQSLDDVISTANQLGLSAVQLHGKESQDFVDQLRAQLNKHCEIWKAYGVTDTLPELLSSNVNKHLLDSKVGTQTGGTGQTFDWQLVSQTKNIMLAGGLSPENVKQAASLGCLGLDLNSGVESAPGKKDAQLLQRAFEQIKNY